MALTDRFLAGRNPNSQLVEGGDDVNGKPLDGDSLDKPCETVRIQAKPMKTTTVARRARHEDGRRRPGRFRVSHQGDREPVEKNRHSVSENRLNLFDIARSGEHIHRLRGSDRPAPRGWFRPISKEVGRDEPAL